MNCFEFTNGILLMWILLCMYCMHFVLANVLFLRLIKLHIFVCVCVCVSLHLRLNSCVWKRLLTWLLILKSMDCVLGMQIKDNLWNCGSSTEILRLNLSKRPERVWSEWAQQDYTKPKLSGCVFVSLFPTLLLWLSKPLYEKCLIPNSLVVFLQCVDAQVLQWHFGWLVSNLSALSWGAFCCTLVWGNNWPWTETSYKSSVNESRRHKGPCCVVLAMG